MKIVWWLIQTCGYMDTCSSYYGIEHDVAAATILVVQDKRILIRFFCQVTNMAANTKINIKLKKTGGRGGDQLG